jgi:hypothetical protein
MKYIDLNSKKGFVNLFADYILGYFDHTTVIEVLDCGPFLVVMGETELTNVIDLIPIKKNFLEKYQNYNIKNLNIIDIISYNVKNEYKGQWFKYYNNERPIYSDSEIRKIENNKDKIKFEYPSITITSQFPHGYGLDKGRFDYYFGEYVTNHILNITNADSIEIKYIPSLGIENLVLKLNLENSLLGKKHVLSLLLDTFYTKENISELRKLVESYDILEDLKNPLDMKPWLIKNKIEDVVVV